MRDKARTVATIEARMSSTRLPGKVLMDIMGRPMLFYMIERLRLCKSLDDIIIATTVNPADDVIVEFAENNGVKYYRGSEDDVLLRVLEAARANDVDVIVETTGDCPLIDPTVVDELVALYHGNDYDYVSNTVKRTFPRGLDTQVFSTDKLAEIEGITNNPADRENVSLYFYEVPGRYRLGSLESQLHEKYWDARLTVDTINDFKLIEEIFKRLYPENHGFLLKDIIALVENYPEFLEINSKIQQKEVR